MSASPYTTAAVRQRAQRRTSNLYDTYFTRVVSAWITPVLARAGASPNQVSFVNYFVGLSGCGLIAFGDGPAQLVAGVAAIHLYAILDSVDGELARLLNMRSTRGLFLEDWSAYMMVCAFPLAVSLFAEREVGRSIAIPLAVLFAVLGRNAMPALRRALAQSPPDRRLEPSASPSPHSAHRLRHLLEEHLLNHTNIRVILTTMVLITLFIPSLLAAVRVSIIVVLVALIAREGAIVTMALRGTLIEDEADRLRSVYRRDESD